MVIRWFCWVGLILPVLTRGTLAGVAFYGGAYDGYDRMTDRAAIGWPHVNNAHGATNRTATGAWLNGTLVEDGGAAAEVFVFWGLTDGATTASNWGFSHAFGERASGDPLTHSISVAPDTTYFYRFYATNAAGNQSWAWHTASFSTPSAPVVNTGVGAAPVSYETTSLHGQLTAGISAETFIFWGRVDQGGSFSWAYTNGIGEIGHGSFDVRIEGLTPGVEYVYRCYATNQYGEGWSAAESFTTRILSIPFQGGAYDGYDDDLAVRNIGMPQVDNVLGATNVLTTSAWLNGNLIDLAGASADVTVHWGPDDGQTNAGDWQASALLGTYISPQALTYQVTGLVSGTTYHYRYRIVNDAMLEAWAPASAEFVTLSPPSVDPDAGAAPVALASATLHARLTAGISADITIYWSSNSMPVDWHAENALTVGSAGEYRVRSVATGLDPGMPYYYRVYATNDIGEGWSPVVSFTTPLAPSPAMFEGGFYDGYDGMITTDQMRSGAGTLYLMR